jgi:hypothetical protein
MVNLFFCQVKLTAELSHAYRAAAPSAPRSIEVEFRLQVVVISVSESTSNLLSVTHHRTEHSESRTYSQK